MHNAKWRKYITIKFYDIAVMNVDDLLWGIQFHDLVKISRCGDCRNTFIKMFGHFIVMLKRRKNSYILVIFWKLWIRLRKPKKWSIDLWKKEKYYKNSRMVSINNNDVFYTFLRLKVICCFRKFIFGHWKYSWMIANGRPAMKSQA